MDWWETLKQEQPLKNADAFPAAALDVLAQDVNHLAAFDPDLPGQVMGYLVDAVPQVDWRQVEQYLDQEQQRYQARLNIYYQAVPTHPSLEPPEPPDPCFNEVSLTDFFALADIPDNAFFDRLTDIYFNRPFEASLSISVSLRDRIFNLMQDLNQNLYHVQTLGRQHYALSVSKIESLFLTMAEGRGYLAKLLLLTDLKNWQDTQIAYALTALTGLEQYLALYSDFVVEALGHSAHNQRLHALEQLKRAQIPLEPWVEPIAKLAVGSAKKEREVASPLLLQMSQGAIASVESLLANGKATERFYAVDLLWRLQGKEAVERLRSHLAQEKSVKVKAAIEQKITIVKPTEIAQSPNYDILPINPVVMNAAFPQDAVPLLQQSLDTIYKHVSKSLEKRFKDPEDLARKLEGQKTRFDINRIVEFLEAGTPKQCRQQLYVREDQDQILQQVQALLTHPELQLIHCLRLLMMLGLLTSDFKNAHRSGLCMMYVGESLLLHYAQAHPEHSDLRQFAQILEQWKIDPNRLTYECLSQHRWHEGNFLNWPDEGLWPYFAERLDLLEEALTPSHSTDWNIKSQKEDERANALQIIAKFPVPPEPLVNYLWEASVSGPIGNVTAARHALQKLPDYKVRLRNLLQDRDRSVRSNAAQWLGKIGDTESIEPIKAAIRKEKSDPTKDVLLRTLEKLGAPLDEFFSRETLLADAQKLLKKKLPKNLGWFPFNALPTVHWQDTGNPVEPDILKSLIIQSVKQKQIEPNPILKRQFGLWRPEDRATLGQFMLESWISQDIAPAYTPEEVEQKAQQQAQQEYQWQQRYIQRNPSYASYYNKTQEQLYAAALSHFRDECKGSAIKEKGLLALAALGCDAAAVPTIHQYLKKWYGLRMAQSTVLLQLLSWIEDDSAIQLLLSVANRFRTKGLQKKAAELVDELAKRSGWTRDELADRTIPTAGLDPQGQAILDFGSRQFTLQLDNALTLTLTNPDGKVIKSLPKPRQTDDEELAKAAKKQFSNSRKQLKEGLKLQTARLYEAMCTQRSWRFKDWQQYLNQHPIMRHFCQRLVWAVYQDETLISTFRPLEDGTLTDLADEEITVPVDAQIRLAHTCTIDVAEAWQTHFADYEVKPLLQQFRPDSYQLSDTQTKDKDIKDFEGHLLESFALRSIATKQGYTRGSVEDAGWFYDYRKPFLSLGIEAVVQFTGNFVPEENRTVALESLSFEKLPEKQDQNQTYHYSRYSSRKVVLGKVPNVLLSEVWQDFKSMADGGTGYDPDWQKKSEY